MTTKFRQVKTKIVATLGPATSNYESILALVKAGANMFRLNTSHGTALDHKKNIENFLSPGHPLRVKVPKGQPLIKMINDPTPLIYAILCEQKDTVLYLILYLHASFETKINGILLLH